MFLEFMCMFPFNQYGYVEAPEGVFSWFMYQGLNWPGGFWEDTDGYPCMYDKLDACVDMGIAFSDPDWITPAFCEGVGLVPHWVFPDSPAEEADPAGHYSEYEDLAP